MEAGIALTGTEVKSIRAGKVNFTDSYAMPQAGELWLHALDIQPYEKGNIFNHEPKRKRRLLLHKSEIEKCRSESEEKGMALVPLSIYVNDKGRIKVEIGLCKGKKLFDKRDDIVKTEAQRAIRQAMKLKR